MYDYIKSKTFIHLHLQSINRKVNQIPNNSHVVTLVLLCCRRTTPSTKGPSWQLSTGNIKRTDSSRGRRSTFQSGSPSWSTMKQHPSPWTVVNRWDQLVCVGWWGGWGWGWGGCWRWCLTYSPLISNTQPWTACLQSFTACTARTHIQRASPFHHKLLLIYKLAVRGIYAKLCPHILKFHKG